MEAILAMNHNVFCLILRTFIYELYLTNKEQREKDKDCLTCHWGPLGGVRKGKAIKKKE